MGLVLEIKNINTYYGFSHVLQGVSLEVEQGTVVTLLGRNGVGKTTTLRSVMGLTPAKTGEIIFEGKDIRALQPYAISRMGMGYVPQGRRLFNSLTVKEHLEVYYRNNDGNGWDPEKVLDLFPRLRERYTNKGNELSGGERQMLAIARALVINPKMIIMDEPTEGLAPIIVEEVGKLIRQIKNEGSTILLTEQKMRFALDLADDAYIMSKGEIVYHGLPDDLIKNEEVKKNYLGI